MNEPAAHDDFPHREPVIEMDQVSFSYQDRTIIDRLNLTVYKRDFVGLIGSNGAGKTTLLRMIVGLIKPDGGEIRLFGQPVGRFKDWERIGYVPQRNALNPLFPSTVKEMVMSGLYGRKHMYRRLTRQDAARCEEAMQALGIGGLAGQLIGRLSGGQQQRVMLARALVNSPELLILDEPMAGVDAETQEAFFRILDDLHRHRPITFLMVSHDVDAIRRCLGQEPRYTSGKLSFYIKHAEETEERGEPGLEPANRSPLRADLETIRHN